MAASQTRMSNWALVVRLPIQLLLMCSEAAQEDPHVWVPDTFTGIQLPADADLQRQQWQLKWLNFWHPHPRPQLSPKHLPSAPVGGHSVTQRLSSQMGALFLNDLFLFFCLSKKYKHWKKSNNLVTCKKEFLKNWKTSISATLLLDIHSKKMRLICW